VEDFMRTRAGTLRVLGLSIPALLSGAACTGDLDTSRTPPPRGTLGEELYGVVCDRVGAQSLHEDLSGGSYRGICHRRSDGTFADSVDTTLLPALADGQPDVGGNPVPLAKQQQDRAYGIARVETLGRHRTDLISALDVTFPDSQVPVKDLANADPTQSCNSAGMGRLHTELSNLLGRFAPLYDDGTIPQSTEALARVIDAFKASPDAQAAWARFDARMGYRPIDAALGAARPIIAYGSFRDFANAALALLSADSNPYDPNAPRDAQGNRIPQPGSAYTQLTSLLTAAQAELANTTIDPTPPALAVSADPQTGRTVLSRPRTDLEVLQAILYAQDPAFGGGASRYIAQRDPRGFAAVPLVGGALPAPFVDKNGDGLPDVDDLGQFVTSDGKPAPSPFFAVGAPDAAGRDVYQRALDAPGGKLLYAYLDTSHTFSASLFGDLKPLVDPAPNDHHETLTDALAGAYVLFGQRDGQPTSSKAYADGSRVQYDAFQTGTSPLVDLVYAFGQILADPNADDALTLTKTLFQQHTGNVARVIGDGLYARGAAAKHPEAQIPATSTLWDEMIDVTIQIEKEPGLLEDVLRSLGDDASLPLGQTFAAYQANKDHISYDRANLNGPPFDMTTNDGSMPKTPVDRTQPDTGDNRSEMQRFLQAIHDTNGVTACNKDQAIAHAQGLPLIGSGDVCDGGLCGFPSYSPPFAECKAFKIDNLAAFYLDSIVGSANLYFRGQILREGLCFFGICVGAATVDTIEQSSGLGTVSGNGADPTLVGFWDDATSSTFRPKPPWLDRLVFFDIANDSPAPNEPNYTTNHFLADLQGTHIGTAACPERLIADPCSGDATCGSGANVAGDGMVHGLRSCPDGDWLFQRDQDAIFVWEDLGFYKAITPLVSAFAKHKREDLFIALMEALHKHWQTGAGTADECLLGPDPMGNGTLHCSKDGADTYEPLLAQMFSSDLLPALHDLVQIVEALNVPTCTAVDPTTHLCTQPSSRNGIDILADATRALVDPDRSMTAGIIDRRGKVTSVRNDGTTNPQVTPIYLVLEALDGIDAAFADYAKKNPMDTARQAQWRSARSQLVDQFLGVVGQNTPQASFAEAATPKIAPVLIDAIRSQLLAHCPDSFVAPYPACQWARQDAVKALTDTIGGPTFAGAMDVTDAIRRDDAARGALESLLVYLLDAASNNDALAEVLGSTDDLIQVLRDDQNLVPFYRVMATAAAPSTTDPQGNQQRGVVDATTTFLSRIAGHAYGASNTEICADELDPNAVLDVGLANLVTPMLGPDGKTPGRTPLEVILDAIADVNRASPGATDKRNAADYANIATELSEFLLDDQRGLEQFYAIVRQGTPH
jgi:hypothetical protein